MKTWEALKAANEGKKIRRKCWANGVYSFKDESRFCNPALITHYGWKNFNRAFENTRLEDLNWDDIFADDWEIISEKEENERTGKSFVKTHCQYGYALLDEKPPRIDNTVEYVIIGESIYFPHCVIIRRKDSCSFNGKKQWIVPKNSLY